MRKNKFALYISLFASILIVAPLAFSQDTLHSKILFVGNSYTYFWNLPQLVAAMGEARGHNWTTRQSTAGGANLGHHWRGDRGLITQELIKDGDFDLVVLQDHSRRALETPDSLLFYGQLLEEQIEQSGADPVVYMTWSRKWDPYMLESIAAEYENVAKKIGAKVIPVGLAWQRARQLRPGIPLYDPDGSHPSPLGTYLTACVFFKILSGESAVGLPNRLISKDFSGEKLYLTIQSPGDALFCQKVADEVVEQFNLGHGNR